MRSRLFRTFHLDLRDNEQFVHDLRQLLELSPPSQQKAIDTLKQIAVASTSQQEQSLLEELVKQTDEPAASVYDAIDSLRFFYDSLTSPESNSDTAEEIVDDLQSLGVIGADRRPVLLRIVEQVKEASDELRYDALERRAAAGPLPTLRGIGASADLRAVTSKPYASNIAVDDYTPQVIGTVGMISVSIRTSSATPEAYGFQMTRDGAELFVKVIRAALKDLDALTNFSSQNGVRYE